MHRGFAALTIFLLVAACGDGGVDTTEPSQFPTGTVRSWLDSLDGGDPAMAAELTSLEPMLIILAAENAMPIDELAPLLRRGATEGSTADYLAGFADALRARYGGSLAAVAVEGFAHLGDDYAAVTVIGEGEATIVTRREPGGPWQIDLVGTLGPAFIRQIADLLDGTGDDPNGDTVREVYRIDVLPALEAALAHDPENLSLAAEIREMQSLLES